MATVLWNALAATANMVLWSLQRQLAIVNGESNVIDNINEEMETGKKAC